MFKDVNPELEKYFDYASGDIKHDKKFACGAPNPNGYATNRMPLWIKPDRKISVDQVMDFMRDHLENTPLDMRKDVGAGPFENPYRWRPLTWNVDGETYCNERATATQQTGFSFVAQCRSWLPDPVGGIFWFGVDDAASSVYVPMYCGITKVPENFKEGNGDMLDFTFDASFWVFNMVSNLAYTRYNTIHPEIRREQVKLENAFIEEVKTIDKKAAELYKQDKKKGLDFITDFSGKKGAETHKAWLNLYKYLFTRYMDGNIKKVDQKGKMEYNGTGVAKYPDQPGYGEKTYKRIVKETKDQFKMKGAAGH